MMLQNLIVIAIITAAIVYAAVTLLRKRRAFSVKLGCGDDCGCNGSGKKLIS
jgi:hypothetical protein